MTGKARESRMEMTAGEVVTWVSWRGNIPRHCTGTQRRETQAVGSHVEHRRGAQPASAFPCGRGAGWPGRWSVHCFHTTAKWAVSRLQEKPGSVGEEARCWPVKLGEEPMPGAATPLHLQPTHMSEKLTEV